MDQQDTPFQLPLGLPYGTKKVSSSPPVVIDSHVDSGPDLDRWEEGQWLGGFRVGHEVVTAGGEVGIVQDIDRQDGKLVVRLEWGIGALVPMDLDQVKHVDGRNDNENIFTGI